MKRVWKRRRINVYLVADTSGRNNNPVLDQIKSLINPRDSKKKKGTRTTVVSNAQNKKIQAINPLLFINRNSCSTTAQNDQLWGSDWRKRNKKKSRLRKKLLCPVITGFHPPGIAIGAPQYAVAIIIEKITQSGQSIDPSRKKNRPPEEVGCICHVVRRTMSKQYTQYPMENWLSLTPPPTFKVFLETFLHTAFCFFQWQTAEAAHPTKRGAGEQATVVHFVVLSRHSCYIQWLRSCFHVRHGSHVWYRSHGVMDPHWNGKDSMLHMNANHLNKQLQDIFERQNHENKCSGESQAYFVIFDVVYLE